MVVATVVIIIIIIIIMMMMMITTIMIRTMSMPTSSSRSGIVVVVVITATRLMKGPTGCAKAPETARTVSMIVVVIPNTVRTEHRRHQPMQGSLLRLIGVGQSSRRSAGHEQMHHFVAWQGTPATNLMQRSIAGPVRYQQHVRRMTEQPLFQCSERRLLVVFVISAMVAFAMVAMVGTGLGYRLDEFVSNKRRRRQQVILTRNGSHRAATR